MKSILSSGVIVLCILGTLSLTVGRADLQQVAYSTDDAHIPFPIIFVHGFNTDYESWENRTRDEFNGLFAGRYGYTTTGSRRWYTFNQYQGYGHSHARVVEDQKVTAAAIGRLSGKFVEVLGSELPQAMDSGLAKEALKPYKEGEKPFAIPVMHSFGGLVTRGYLNRNPDDQRLARLVFISTPQVGSPLANYFHMMFRMRYDSADIDNKVNQIEEAGTGWLKPDPDWSLWQGVRRLRQFQSAMIDVMDGWTVAEDFVPKEQRDMVPAEDIGWLAHRMTSGLRGKIFATGPNTNVMRDLAVRGDYTSNYVVTGFGVMGLSKRTAEFSLDFHFPDSDVILASAPQLPPFAVVQGTDSGKMGDYVYRFARHPFDTRLFGGINPIAIISAAPRRVWARMDHKWTGLHVEGLPTWLELEKIVDGGDAIVPAASIAAIGGSPIIEVEANHNEINIIAPAGVTNEWQAILQGIYPHDPKIELGSLYFIPENRDSTQSSQRMVVRIEDYLFQSSSVAFMKELQAEVHDLSNGQYSNTHRRRLTPFRDPYGHNIEMIAREVPIPISFGDKSLHEIEILIVSNAQGNASSHESLYVLTPTSLMRTINERELAVDFSSKPMNLRKKEEPQTAPCPEESIPSLTIWRHHALQPYAERLSANNRRDNIDSRYFGGEGYGNRYLLLGHSLGHEHAEIAYKVPKLASEAIYLGGAGAYEEVGKTYMLQMTAAIDRLLDYYGKDEWTPYSGIPDLLASAGAIPATGWDENNLENWLNQIELVLQELTTPLKRDFIHGVWGKTLSFPIFGFSEFRQEGRTPKRFKKASFSGSGIGAEDPTPTSCDLIIRSHFSGTCRYEPFQCNGSILTGGLTVTTEQLDPFGGPGEPWMAYYEGTCSAADEASFRGQGHSNKSHKCTSTTKTWHGWTEWENDNGVCRAWIQGEDRLSNEDKWGNARSRAAASENCTYVNDFGVTIDPWRGWYFKPLTFRVSNPWAWLDHEDPEKDEVGCYDAEMCVNWSGPVWSPGLSWGRSHACSTGEFSAKGCANFAWGFGGIEELGLPTAVAATYHVVFDEWEAPPGTELDVNWKVVRRENAGSFVASEVPQDGATTERKYTKTIELKKLMSAPQDEHGSTDFSDPSWETVEWAFHDQPWFELGGLARAEYRFVAFSNEPVTFQWTVERESAAGIVTTEHKSATTSGSSGVHWTPPQQELTDNGDLSSARIVNVIASGGLVHDVAGGDGTWAIDWKRRQGVWGHQELTGQEEEYYLERWTTWRQTYKTTGASPLEDECGGIPLGYTPLDLETIYTEVQSYETGIPETFVPENGDRFIYNSSTETHVYRTGFRTYVPKSREGYLMPTGRPFNSRENEFFVFATEQDTKTKWEVSETRTWTDTAYFGAVARTLPDPNGKILEVKCKSGRAIDRPDRTSRMNPRCFTGPDGNCGHDDLGSAEVINTPTDRYELADLQIGDKVTQRNNSDNPDDWTFWLCVGLAGNGFANGPEYWWEMRVLATEAQFDYTRHGESSYWIEDIQARIR